MKGNGCLAAGLCILLCLAGCRSQGKAPLPGADSAPESSAPAVPVDSVPAEEVTEPFDANTSIQAVMDDPVFGDTGLFFFKGNPGEKFALCNAGGFAYVGAMQDSFPHALTLSKQGYNAFALIYRPGAQTACEDLARAISFIFAHAQELEVDTGCYSLWGGSAGARMAAWLGSYGPAAFGGDDLPRPGAVIMQYTGHTDYTENDPPTFACVGESDGIANWHTMERRLQALDGLGIATEFHHYPGLPHGFGLGTGTVAEGWINQAVAFWEAQMMG